MTAYLFSYTLFCRKKKGQPNPFLRTSTFIEQGSFKKSTLLLQMRNLPLFFQGK